MRNSNLNFFLFFIFLISSFVTVAQKEIPVSTRSRCGTMEALDIWFNQHPKEKEKYLQNLKEGEAKLEAAKGQQAYETQRLGSVIYIPIVFHLVLGASDQAKITKADVLWQLNKLNEDYAGTNADSTNASNFYSVRGHSQIQFCLAQQDPNGDPTDGINRIYSTITNFSSSTVGNLKHGNSCGADAWDPDRYFNVWVSRSTTLLGIATFPQTGAANEQGVAIAMDGFSNNPAYVSPAFALGRTLVHETGHYFGLYHIWGDDGTDCSGDDFRQVPGTCLLPLSLLTGDTPNQAGATAGCPGGVRTDACTISSPGYMYQNYMDYTDDGCYSLFTEQQVARAEYILMNCRASLLTSNGCAPPTVFANDAGITVLSPGNSCYPGGVNSTICANSSFNVQVMLRNLGSTNITSATISAVLGSGAVVSTNFTGDLAPFASTIVTINGMNAGSVPGSQILKVYSSNPNLTADQRTSNDTTTTNINVISNSNVTSVSEGFESASFPPSGWSVINPNPGTLTWERTTNAMNSGLASAYINLFNYSTTNDLDYLVSPGVNVTNADSVVVDFSRAYKRYSTGPTSADSLMIQLATQCGASYFPITAWSLGGDDLSTSPGTYTGNWIPISSEWLRDRVDLLPFIPGGTNSISVAFVSKNRYGQNLYLDDINIRVVHLIHKDAALKSIPVSRQCSAAFTPSVELLNSGKDTLTSARIVYILSGPSLFRITDSINFSGNLPAGASIIIPLKPVVLGNYGVYSLRAFTKLPNGQPDQNTSNDTMFVQFRFVATVPAPLFEGFEASFFPPQNWSRTNADGSGTWFRTTAASYTGTASAAIDNFNYDARGTNDDLESPVITYNGIDSAFMTFRLAHATYLYPGSTGLPLDTLEIFVSKDCGQTLIPVYSKWGEDLQTVNNPNAPYINLFIPNKNQWRLETINLSSVLGSSGGAQIVIRNKGNYGNTTFVDDIKIFTKTLPAKLKANGYLIAPNPFRTGFTVQHYLQPVALRGIQVTNLAGQTVFSRQYNGNAQSNMYIDLGRYAAGIYMVRMIYNDKVITERLIKR